MHLRIIIAFLLLTTLAGQAQDPIFQRVRGAVRQVSSQERIAGASVSIGDHTAVTGDDGTFTIQVPIGRYLVRVTAVGFESAVRELNVEAGKEAIMDLYLQASTTFLEAVSVTASSAEPLVPAVRSLSIEKTLRVPANFFDPMRVFTSYPGVVTASDQNNAVIVRGNSPNGLLWTLNGLHILNPNHLANAGTISDRPAANGGGVNILSAQMLASTNFYPGTVPGSEGNALSGIAEMNLRDANDEQVEFTAQASLIGLDLSAEGPLKKSQTGVLANYRYSTVGLLSDLGVDFGGESISFQDLSLHLTHKPRADEIINFFMIGGLSSNQFKQRKISEWEEDKDRYNIEFDGSTILSGLTYKKSYDASKLSLGIAYSRSQQQRNARLSPEYTAPQIAITQSAFDLQQQLASLRAQYDINVSSSVFKVGITTDFISNDLDQSDRFGCNTCPENTRVVSGNYQGLLLQPFFEWQSKLTTAVDLNAGIRFQYFTYNESKSIEPRLSLTWKTSAKSSVLFGYSLISQVQLPQVYLQDGNASLAMSKSHRLDGTYTRYFSNDIKVTAGIYYQHLFDIPVEKISSAFSTLNLLDEVPPGQLINAGTGNNYGFDLTTEKYFADRSYLITAASMYDSRYKGSDAIDRNTRFNGNYTLSLVYGREWKRSRNRVISANMRILRLGGLRTSEILLAESVEAGETVYDQSVPFDNRLKDYTRADFRISFRKNKPGYTRTLAMDVQNLLNLQNESYRYYDQTRANIVTKYHLGVIPVLVYRIDF